jgi:RNA polymerase sigma-54 factor
MRHKLSHHQRILLKFALTPQMKQSIKLLAMSTRDLQDFIETAVTSNPFLKKESGKRETDRYRKTGTSTRTDVYEAPIRQEENPRARLVSQVRMLGLKGKVLEIAEYLIYEMDDNGYIPVDPDDVSSSLSVDIDEVKRALEAIQGMDPPGIGAQDVGECLRLQLKRAGKEKSLEYAIVTRFIQELAREDIDKISKALKTDKEKVRSAIAAIKKLNPRPASTFLSKESVAVIPDLLADLKENSVELQLNRGWLPQLALHNPYEHEPDVAEDSEAKKFIKAHMEAAKHLIDDLKRREETIYKVAHYILTFQLECLCDGENEVKSLTINDVGRALNLHPSTISRAISNKYVQIDNDVIPLNSLLSKGMKKSNGDDISKTAVKKKIEALVKNENRTAPLSDEAIKKILEKEGIKLGRRTITKYRVSLRILPTHLRKKAKARDSG